MRRRRNSIRTTLFVAFIALCAIIAAQGYYGYFALSKTGAMVIDMFDRPLMAINYARAANIDFAHIERLTLERSYVGADRRSEIDADINDLLSNFAADLRVARERSPEADELKVITRIRALVAQWSAARRMGNRDAMDTLARRIDDAFDILIEFNTDHSFISRRQSVDAIAQFAYILAAALAASLVLAFFIVMFLSRRIASPLSQAAAAANRIAAGEFETPIPAGGSEETRVLLHSMTVMQDNIRAMVERQTARAMSAEGRLVDAVESSDEGVMLVGPDNRLIIVNSRLRAYFPDFVESFVPGASYAALTRKLGALFEDRFEEEPSGGMRVTAGEHRLPDGRWVRISISATSDRGKIVFVSDFTEIKQREESYKQAKQEAEAASAAKSRFLANMSHELRTPLNAIIGFSEIFTAQLFGALGNPRYVEYAHDILLSGRHLLDVINCVLDLSKSAAGQLRLCPEDVDLREVLLDCVKLISKQCVDAGLTLNTTGLNEALPVRGEKAKLRQIFLNLLSNAVKFTGRGGAVSIDVARQTGGITVAVSDTGIGMTAQDIQVALTPFGQVDNRLERKYEGTGLGLPLAQNFVELHGGKLHIESTKGRGTTVVVRIGTAVDAIAQPAPVADARSAIGVAEEENFQTDICRDAAR